MRGDGREPTRVPHTYLTPSPCQLAQNYSSPTHDPLPPPPTARHRRRLSLPTLRLLLGEATPVAFHRTPGLGTSTKHLPLCQSQLVSPVESARARGHIPHVLLRYPRRLHQQLSCAQVCAPPDPMRKPRGHREHQQLGDDHPTPCEKVRCVHQGQ